MPYPIARPEPDLNHIVQAVLMTSDHQARADHLRAYNTMHGLDRLNLRPAELVSLRPDLAPMHYDMLGTWAVAELARTELDDEAFLDLVFIEVNENYDRIAKIRHLGREGRSLRAVVHHIDQHHDLEELFGSSDWLARVGDIYHSFDYGQLATLLLTPSHGASEQAAGSWYLEDGNHRALALALKLRHDAAFRFRPVPAILVFRDDDVAQQASAV